MKKIIGILVCNSQKVLDHKQKDGKRSEGNYCYWEMTRFPNRILEATFPQTTGVVSESALAPSEDLYVYAEDDQSFPEDVEIRLYFAVGGQVKGYFVSEAMGEQNGVSELRFFSESWTEIKPIQIKPSQGFRYFNHQMS